ncbi:uncharacterized protein TNCV_631081 [Trichonephila clavipes]|nr:uncharacterized protein TNCV_631081 [Trichonephila clavipes]
MERTEVDVEPQPSTSTVIRKSFGWSFQIQAWANYVDAITIHKSQGGTFDEVVFNYDKSQQIQLVYVALSRVTSIDGLYFTNDKDDFKFYHGRGSTAPTVKDIRDEYDRMPIIAFPRCQCKQEPSRDLMNCANTVMINGFELRASNNTALEHRTHCPSTSSELPVRVSAAGGSAIYKTYKTPRTVAKS